MARENRSLKASGSDSVTPLGRFRPRDSVIRDLESDLDVRSLRGVLSERHIPRCIAESDALRACVDSKGFL